MLNRRATRMDFIKCLTAGYSFIFWKKQNYTKKNLYDTPPSRKKKQSICSFKEAVRSAELDEHRDSKQEQDASKDIRGGRVPECCASKILTATGNEAVLEKGFQRRLLQLKTEIAPLLWIKHCSASVLTQHTAEVFKHCTFEFLICYLVCSRWKYLLQWWRNLNTDF